MGRTRDMRRAAVILCLCLCTLMLLLAGCAEEKTSDPSIPEGVGTLPENTNGFIIGNLSIILPREFKQFDPGNDKWNAAFNDGYAQFYVRKCLPEDTGTSPSYFDRLTASEYGDLLLYGTYDYDEYKAHNKDSAGFFYFIPGETAETTVCVCDYVIKDKKTGCFWLVECRFTYEYAERYVALFETWDEYFVLRG